LHKNPDTSEEGLERLRAAVKANPRSTTFVALAHLLCEAGRAPEAEDVCREGLSRHPGLVTGQVALGRALLDRGRMREAQEVLIAAAKANPDHGDAFRWLGEVTIKRNDLPRARALLEYAEELSPNDRRVTELLIEAGGTPTFRSARPRTDFEHTKISNARALADRMHEDPNDDPTRVGPELSELLAADSTDGERSAPRSNAALGIDEPTVVDGRAALDAWRSSAHEEADHDGDSEEILPAQAGELQGLAAPAISTHASEPRVQVSPVEADLTPVSVSGVQIPARRTQTAALPVRQLWRSRPLVMSAAAVGLALLGVVVFLATREDGGAVEELRGRMNTATAAGSLAGLTTARELGQQIVAARPSDGGDLAALAFVDTLLIRDYGLPLRKEAEDLLARARADKGASAARTGVIEAVAALLALGAGQLAEAQQSAERAVTATPDGAPALLAGARVKIHNADLEGARRDLERLLARTPDYAHAVTDWAAIWIDSGDPSTASQSLRDQIKRTRDHLPARLLLAEAERALGDRSAVEGLAAQRPRGRQRGPRGATPPGLHGALPGPAGRRRSRGPGSAPGPQAGARHRGPPGLGGHGHQAGAPPGGGAGAPPGHGRRTGAATGGGAPGPGLRGAGGTGQGPEAGAARPGPHRSRPAGPGPDRRGERGGSHRPDRAGEAGGEGGPGRRLRAGPAAGEERRPPGHPPPGEGPVGARR
jgi:tetratricopeptide (TPR) repeat protein